MPHLKAAANYSSKTCPGSYYKPIDYEDMYYNMNRRHRRLAIIFNHEDFENGWHSKRRGTKNDRDRLEAVLKSLGFEVDVKDDLRYKAIHNIIQNLSKMDFSHYDCLLVAVLSHGHLGMLYARDIPYRFRCLWEPFTDKRCPSLAGKPKIFFIQACRGDKYDDGIRLETDGPTALSENPTNPDFVIGFSTVPGYYSWRNNNHGSWYIQALCDIFIDCANDNDILTMLTYVSQKVALDFESYTPDDAESDKKLAMPCVHSTLTRLLLLNINKKNSKNDCCIH